MTFDEYKKDVQPGMRVYVVHPNGAKMYGTAAHTYGPDGIEHLIRFDNGKIGKVNERSVGIVHMDKAN